jgi:hypothetical protein
VVEAGRLLVGSLRCLWDGNQPSAVVDFLMMMKEQKDRDANPSWI